MTKTFVNRLKIGAECLLLPFLLLLGIPFTVSAGETIKIGKLEPMSGFMAHWGEMSEAACQMIAEEQNAKGGVLGKKVEFVFEDNEYRPEVAIRKAKKLILEAKVDFMGTGVGSHISIAMNKLATSYKKIYLNFGGISDSIQGKEFSLYGFRMVNSAYQSAAALVEFAKTKPFRKFYMINPDYTFGHEYAAAFKQQMKIRFPDAQIVGEDYHPMGTKDFAPYVTKIIASGADAIFAGSFSTDARLLVKAARGIGLKAPFPFFSYAMVESTNAEQLRDEAVGISSVNGWSVGVNTPENNEMVAKWHKKFKDKRYDWWWPSSNVAWEFMGWPMFFAAVEKAKSLEPDKIIDALEGLRYKTPIGWYTMRKCDHQVILPMFAFEIKPGKNKWFDWPWIGPDVMTIPADSVAPPATADYNPRCP